MTEELQSKAFSRTQGFLAARMRGVQAAIPNCRKCAGSGHCVRPALSCLQCNLQPAGLYPFHLVRVLMLHWMHAALHFPTDNVVCQALPYR